MTVPTLEPPPLPPTPLERLPVEASESPEGPPRVAWWRRARSWISSAIDWLFGASTLVIGLAVLAALPIAQFLCLGYLLESAGRVGRTGRFVDGFVGIRKASRLGKVVFGIWLCSLPLQLIGSLTRSAELIDPGGPAAGNWRMALGIISGLTALHVIAACARGGRIVQFLWPIGAIGWIKRTWRGGRFYTEPRDACLAFLGSLRLPHYFKLGLLGFLGSLAWLLLPVALIAAGVTNNQPGLTVIGALALGFVVLRLPFLQVRFAVEGRFRAFLETRAIRERYRRAPWAFALALTVTVLASIPLYLLKIEMIPREAAWLPSLVFLIFIGPTRILNGWAYFRGQRRENRRHWFFRLSTRLAMFPVAAVYALFAVLSQFTAWRGLASLYEQHAFLIPVPFISIQ